MLKFFGETIKKKKPMPGEQFHGAMFKEETQLMLILMVLDSEILLMISNNNTLMLKLPEVRPLLIKKLLMLGDQDGLQILDQSSTMHK